LRARYDYTAGLIAPAAVRIVDLDAPLEDLALWSDRLGAPYRSLLAIARFDSEPLGAVTLTLGRDGRVPSERLREIIRDELESELRDALLGRGLDLPDSLPSEGIAYTARDDMARQPAGRSVSVVITTCGAPMELERCLRSVLACDYADFDVIVVDNRPRSHTTARLLDERFEDEPRLRYVEAARAGLSHARNAGLAQATGELVMFTDDDMAVDPGWIGQCAAAFSSSDAACVTGLILPLELETEAQLRFERCARLGNGLRRQIFSLPETRVTHPFFFYRPGVMGAGANTALLAGLAHDLGGFDMRLGAGTPTLGGEDLDLYVRLLSAGHTLVYDPSVIAWHEHPDSARRVRWSSVRRGTAVGAALTKRLVVRPERRQLLRAVPNWVRYELDGPRAVGVVLGPAAYAASALAAASEPRQLWRRWHAGMAVASASDRALAAIAAGACLLAVALVAAGAPGLLRLLAVLAMLCLAPGTALLVLLGARRSIEPGLAIGASLSIAAVVAQSMLWLGTWWPEPWLYLMAAACLPALIGTLRGRSPPESDERTGTWVEELELVAPLSDLGALPAPDRVRGEHEPGETEPFVSIILSADRYRPASVERSLRSVLALDYPSFEVVVARGGASTANGADRDFAHPLVRYVDEPSRDACKARGRAARAALGDVLAFTEGNVVVDGTWLRALMQRLAPASRVGCVTGPVASSFLGHRSAAGVNFAASREALRSVGAFERGDAPSSRRGNAEDGLVSRLVEAGWAVCHEPAAIAWRPPGWDGSRLGLRRRLMRWRDRARDGLEARALVRPSVAHAAVLSAAVAWAFSLRHTDLDRIAGIGLLDALPPTYFVAFGLLLAGFIAAVTRPVLPMRLLWVYVAALIIVLHGTTPLLYDEPRYTWTYTHLGVVALIAHTGAVDRTIDIYNNWPGFFALVAWLTSAAGIGAASFAAWAQVFFNMANVVAVQFALRGVTRDERLVWTATLLFLLGNWVGQDYLAPQAFAFVLSLVLLGLCLRCGTAMRPPRSPMARWWTGVLDRLRERAVYGPAPDEPPPSAPLSPRGALVVGGLCYLAIVVSHQLTPVILIIGVTGLAVFARRVPLWIPVAMAGIEAWWLWLSWSYVSERFTLLDPAPASSARPAGYQIGDGLPGLELVAYAVRAELVIIVVLAALGLMRRLRAGRWDLAPTILVVAPLMIVGVQSYGGEGRYRAYLFALPWLAFFAAAAIAPMSAKKPALARRARLAVASAALGVCLLFAYFGLELMNRVGSDDVAAARWFERHGPPDSLVVGVTTNRPSRLTARYPMVYDPAYSGAPSLIDHAEYRGRRLGVADLPRIESTLRAYGAPHTFVRLGTSQENHARLYGLLPAGSVQRLDRALRTSSSFRLVYQRGSSSIYEFRPSRDGGSEAFR
jgi:glycosyltransferase involved in cell wall biosynthesis